TIGSVIPSALCLQHTRATSMTNEPRELLTLNRRRPYEYLVGEKGCATRMPLLDIDFEWLNVEPHRAPRVQQIV
ncbi:MAG TPA: hypothetical protein VE131_02355, partial [Terriglobales bacterium]|nr:hypothetical protein [Terriglobales bacterium]